VDPGGVHLGGGFLKLRPRDMARLGSVYLDEGRWGGRQVVPAEWVREATRAHVDVVGPVSAARDYGYLWWVTTAGDEPAYFALGFGGQLIEVVPGRDLVVVVSTAYDLLDPQVLLDDRTLPRMVEEVVLPELEAAGADDG
jgi:CubicO group peptidase (beta-lactamase class C family)